MQSEGLPMPHVLEAMSSFDADQRRAAISEATFIARSILAPDDLAGRAVYILPSHQIDARYSIPGAHGWTSCCLDLQLRSWLTERGLWSGRGFVAILNSPDLSHSHIRAVVAHELAHWLVHSSDPAGRDDVDQLTDPLDLQTVQAYGQPHACVENRAERDAWLLQNPQPPWHGHGLHFQRALAHVYRRGRRAFRFIEPAELGMAGAHYALSPPGDYLQAFGAELEGYGGSIAELLNTPVPRAACELFLHDVDSWLAQIPTCPSPETAGKMEVLCA